MTYALVRVKKLAKDAVIPQCAHADDIGADLSSVEGIILTLGQRALVGTSIAIALPAGTVRLAHPRFGLAFKKGLPIVNASDTIDVSYRGELKVCLINLDLTNAMEIAKGDRIAQLVVQKAELSPMAEVDELDETERGAGGHGSTGVSMTP